MKKTKIPLICKDCYYWSYMLNKCILQKCCYSKKQQEKLLVKLLNNKGGE